MSAASVVAMPRLSDSMEEGTIVRWLKQDGEEVARGDELVEIETDKATMTFEAESSGVLRRLVAEGATVALGSAIAELLSTKPEPWPPVGPAAGRNGGGLARGPRVAASPVARRLALRLGVDLETVAGTGPRGRIVKRDVEAAAPPAPAATPAPAVAPADGSKGARETLELSRVQATVARRMAESRATVPDFFVEVDVMADALVELRERLREGTGDDPLPSYNDFIVKACAKALRAHPTVNGAYRGGAVERYGRVNVGVAVAARESLFVPVVHDADERSLGTIARETRRLAGRARDGTLTAAELSAGTFTVSNLGMLGVKRFSAVINVPQAAILAIGALDRRAVVLAGGVQAAHVMTLTLCADHRILYGADAAAFLSTVRAGLEEPLGLLL